MQHATDWNERQIAPVEIRCDYLTPGRPIGNRRHPGTHPERSAWHPKLSETAVDRFDRRSQVHQIKPQFVRSAGRIIVDLK